MTMPTMRPERRQRPPTQYRIVDVRRIERVTPRQARVTFGGENMESFAPGAAAESIKLTFPAPGEKMPTMPIVGINGTVYSPEQEKQPAAGLHGPQLEREGVGVGYRYRPPRPRAGGSWASSARPGDALVIAEPRGAYKIDQAAPWMLLAGDEAAMPAIATILRELPATTEAQVYLEVHDAAEEQPLPTQAKLRVAWLHRESETLPKGQLVAAALTQNSELPLAPGRVWLACEAGAMRDIRKHLLLNPALDRTRVATQSYWKYGAANHSDHDWGTEV